MRSQLNNNNKETKMIRNALNFSIIKEAMLFLFLCEK